MSVVLHELTALGDTILSEGTCNSLVTLTITPEFIHNVTPSSNSIIINRRRVISGY